MGHKLDQDLSESLQGPRVLPSEECRSKGWWVFCIHKTKKKNKKKFLCAWVTPKDLNFGSWRRKRRGAQEGGQLMDDKDLLHPHYTTSLPLTRCCYYYKPTWHCHNKEGIHLHPFLLHENCWTGECGSNAGAPAHMECSQSTVYNMSYRFPKKPNSSHFLTPIHLLQKKRGGCLSLSLSMWRVPTFFTFEERSEKLDPGRSQVQAKQRTHKSTIKNFFEFLRVFSTMIDSVLSSADSCWASTASF